MYNPIITIAINGITAVFFGHKVNFDQKFRKLWYIKIEINKNISECSITVLKLLQIQIIKYL